MSRSKGGEWLLSNLRNPLAGGDVLRHLRDVHFLVENWRIVVHVVYVNHHVHCRRQVSGRPELLRQNLQQNRLIFARPQRTTPTHLELHGVAFLEVQQVIVAHVDEEVRPPLGDVRRDLKRAVVSEQRQREHAVLSGVVVVHSGHVRVVENQCRPLQGVLVDASHVAAIETHINSAQTKFGLELNYCSFSKYGGELLRSGRNRASCTVVAIAGGSSLITFTSSAITVSSTGSPT